MKTLAAQLFAFPQGKTMKSDLVGLSAIGLDLAHFR
jgi:hypothetical protein